MKKKNINKGLSLIEILVVVSVFAALGIIVSRSVISTLRSARKSDSQVNVRQNLNYAVSVIERQIRGANTIDPCPNTSQYAITYLSNERINTSFSCIFPSGDGYVASGSARLTSESVLITECSFSCTQPNLNSPPVVTVSLTAEDAVNKTVEGSTVTVQTEITLRNY